MRYDDELKEVRYIKRKKETERIAEEARMAKIKARPRENDIFGDSLRKPLSPRLTVPSPGARAA